MNPTQPAPTTSAQALSEAQQFQQGLQSPQQYLDAANNQYGTNAAQQQVSGLRSAINNTTTLLNNVAPGVMGRTGQSLETSAQANREIQNEQAPISTQLDKENSDYNTANSNYSDLEQKAESLANSNETGDQNKLGYLMNIYSALYGQEQSAAQAATQEKQFEEGLTEDRETKLASSGGESSGIGGALSSLFGGSSGGSSGAQAQQRDGDKGFSFTDANGKTINAVGYSQAKGVPIRTLLQNMATEGDSGAKTALNYIGNDLGVNEAKLKNLVPSPSTYNATVRLLQSLGFKV